MRLWRPARSAFAAIPSLADARRVWRPFGASPADVAQVAAWLTGHGFAVEEIPASNRLIFFSGRRDRSPRRFTQRFIAIR